MVTDIAKNTVRIIAERMDRELHGAWRAGYDYLHVYEEPTNTQIADGELKETFTIRQYVRPSNQPEPLTPESLQYRYTYDIGSVDDDVIREALRG